MQAAFFAIESIARGSLRPSRLILWVAEEEHPLYPASIRRLQQRGLEVKRCKNYGSHKKYYPYVESQQLFNLPLVTADDDILYPGDWLTTLVEAHQQYPHSVNCYWAQAIVLSKGRIINYSELKQCTTTIPSYKHLAVGMAGIIYPPSFLMALKHAGTGFAACCPTGDDLWLHVQALRAGYPVRQIVPQLPYFAFQAIPGAHHSALSTANLTQGNGNDRQIRLTYTRADLHMLRYGRASGGSTLQLREHFDQPLPAELALPVS